MNLTSPQTIQYIKKKYNFNMSKGLGQNFLLDQSVLDKIVDAAELCAESGALEIGPGIGVLTAELSKASKKTVAIEIDTRLLPVLDETLGEYDNIEIINDDVLKTNLATLINDKFSNCSDVSIAANLPYYITTPILTHLLENNDLCAKNIVVMVQKEVAQRLCATPKSKNYSSLSVLVAYHCTAEIVTTVPASSFMPPPKVDSAVVKLAMRKEPPISPKSEKIFFKTVRAAFCQRRKTLVNALCGSGIFTISKDEIKRIVLALGFGENARGEELSLEQFCALSDALYEAVR